MSVNHHTDAERALSARRLRALADLFKLAPGSVAPSVRVLLESPCERFAAPTWAGNVTESVEAWVEGGEQPPLSEELHRLFGEGFCECSLPTVPACAAFYVEDADTMRAQLISFYEEAGYAPTGLSGTCEGTSYISHQLEFLAHCIEDPERHGATLEAALPVMQDSLFEWAGLFARAVVSSSRHPGVIYAGLTLECVLQNDPIVSALARAA